MAETGGKDGRGGRWVRVALAVSLALNVLVVGVVIGAILAGGGRDDRRRPPLGGLGVGPFAEALDERDRRAIGRQLRREAGTLSANRAEIRRQTGALLAALRAEPFDPAAVAAALEAQRATLAERQALGERLLLERLSAMSAAERAAFAERLEARFARRRR